MSTWWEWGRQGHSGSCLAWRVCQLPPVHNHNPSDLPPWQLHPGGLFRSVILRPAPSLYLPFPHPCCCRYLLCPGDFPHDQMLFFQRRVLWLAPEVWSSSWDLCPMSEEPPQPSLGLCVLHPSMGWLHLPTSRVSCEGVIPMSLLNLSARMEWTMDQLYQHVWSLFLRAGQPHFNSVYNLRGHKCNFILFCSWEHLKPWWGLLILKGHVYKHTYFIFVILFDDKEGKHKSPHRHGREMDISIWHHS